MRARTLLASVLAGLTLTFVGGGLTGTVDAASPTQEQGFVDKINNERTSRGLRPLIFDLQIRDVARGWSDYMARTGDFRHNPNYASQMPAGWSRAAENIAWGSGTSATVDALHTALMNSAGHRANILGDFTRVGVGVTFAANGRMYVTQNFGKYAGDPVPTTTTTTTSTTAKPATTTTTAPSSSTISLTVSKGTWDNGTKSKAMLRWSGATGSYVDVYRNGAKVVTTANDGAWDDKFSTRLPAGTVRSYKVCRQSTTVCSPTRSVTF